MIIVMKRRTGDESNTPCCLFEDINDARQYCSTKNKLSTSNCFYYYQTIDINYSGTKINLDGLSLKLTVPTA